MCCECMNRRQFLGVSTGILAGVSLAALGQTRAAGAEIWTQETWNPARPLLAMGLPLRIQPILMYSTPQKREQTSWKSWGGVQTDTVADEEALRIAAELKQTAEAADFRLEVLPVIKVKTPEEAAQAHQKEFDVAIVYAATGSKDLLEACAGKRDAILFVRHRSGPAYYWYEAMSTRFLATDDADTGKPQTGRLSVHDVVVDDLQELTWRLRALYGVNNFLGARIVALGGAAGKYAADAVQVARDKYKLDIIEVGYDVLEPRLLKALADPVCMAQAEAWTQQYLAMPDTQLDTERPFVVNSFVLYGLFKEIMQEHNAQAFTIKDCMGIIMPMSKTTACLTLSLMNDEGLFAFCESDFVIVPAGMLMRYITNKPVFMHNSTFPHAGIVTCAHCTGPRRMNGDKYEPARIVTHYESEYGAAPKVQIPVGQELTLVSPEYASGRWLGFRGIVKDNPFYEICRSQQDVEIQGDWKKLIKEVRDSHWIMTYGNYLREAEYAARKIGLRWETIA